MQLLIALSVMIGVVVVAVAVLGGASYGLGVYFYSRESVAAGPGSTDACAQCNADSYWYQALPDWKKTVMAAWWAVNRITCALKGCR